MLRAREKERCMSPLGKFASVLLLPVSLALVAAPLDGTFALQTGAAKTNGFLRATTIGGNPLEQHLDIWMTRERSAQPILRYSVDMTKLLHVIIVSDDFARFLHVHPVLGPDGHFTIDQRFPEPALYHVYADGEPDGIGQQVFRFDLAVAGGAAAGARDLPSTGPKRSAGPYTVELSTTTVPAGNDVPVTVHIRHGTRPAGDLHPYLGALAHAVFLDARDLSYVHVHPLPLAAGPMNSMPGMAMSNMPGMGGMDMKALPDSATSSPDMQLRLRLREAGTYKLWLQFRGGRSLYVAPFVIVAH
jgi:hypothetical protein